MYSQRRIRTDQHDGKAPSIICRSTGHPPTFTIGPVVGHSNVVATNLFRQYQSRLQCYRYPFQRTGSAILKQTSYTLNSVTDLTTRCIFTPLDPIEVTVPGRQSTYTSAGPTCNM